MLIERFIVTAALAVGMMAATAVDAATVPAALASTGELRVDPIASPGPAPLFQLYAIPAVASSQFAGDGASAGTRLDAQADALAEADSVRATLIALAMKLRDIRYVRGGHSPSTGFDCSGFVRYVFARSIGLNLPSTSAGQFLAGLKVKRGDLLPGDLVFFHTRGRKRVSHVGIYIDNGRFIHSPRAGKSVEISSLGEPYWSRRFIGARRPKVIAQSG
jgi:cell wall-associated NlpC family hydrolase